MTTVEAMILLCVAAGWETSTHAGPFGVAGPRLVYRWTWWISPLSLVAAGVLLASTAETQQASAVGALAALAAFVTAARFPLRRIADDSEDVSRRSVSRDPNRRPRLIGLAASGVVLVGALLLNA